MKKYYIHGDLLDCTFEIEADMDKDTLIQMLSMGALAVEDMNLVDSGNLETDSESIMEEQ